MALALLSSRSTKVNLADLDAAPRLKKEAVTPLLLRRIGESLQDGAKDMLLERPVEKTQRGTKVSLPECVVQHLREIPMASPTDKVRCFPPEPAAVSSDEEEESSTSESESLDKAEEVSSLASSAEDRSDIEDDS